MIPRAILIITTMIGGRRRKIAAGNRPWRYLYAGFGKVEINGTKIAVFCGRGLVCFGGGAVFVN
jgi:hypothetical protein